MSKVLFVDDDPNILHSLHRVVRGEPYAVLTAAGGREALTLLAEQNVGVLVTDLKMPGMDGLELLRRVKTDFPEVVRLVLSVKNDGRTILSALENGDLYRYILKPWDATELKVTIRQALDLYSLHRQRKDLIRELMERNKQLEEHVEQRTRQLLAVQNSADIGRYTSQIVHDLNGPLQSIYGGLDLAELGSSGSCQDAELTRKGMCLARQGARDLNELISGILLHARNAMEANREFVDVNKIIEEEFAVFEFNPFFRYEVEKCCEFSDNPPRIFGSAVELKQMVHNLIKNAVEAMENSPQKRIIVRTEADDGGVVISVSDTGEGIAGEHLEAIFSPHFTTKPLGKGTGLGLSSVKTMVEAYRGTVHVESEPGRGATFTVRLPENRNGLSEPRPPRGRSVFHSIPEKGKCVEHGK